MGSNITLYQIQRVSDGLLLVGDTMLTWPSKGRGTWSASGAFWRRRATVQKHLYQLCCDWDLEMAGSYCVRKRVAGPRWSRLEGFDVRTLRVSVGSRDHQSAKRFMGTKLTEVTS